MRCNDCGVFDNYEEGIQYLKSPDNDVQEVTVCVFGSSIHKDKNGNFYCMDCKEIN